MKDIELIRESAAMLERYGIPSPDLRALADRMEAQGKREAICWVHAKNGETNISWGSEKPKTVAKLNWFPLFAYPPDAATRIAELEAESARLIREMLVLSVDHEAQLAEYKADAERYRRTRVLGAAINECTPLLRFTNLDVFIDRDIKVNPSRGEFKDAAIAKVKP